MANEVQITVDGAEVLRMLDRLGPAAQDHVVAVSKLTADRIQAEAKSRARRATGVLQDAIEVRQVEEPLFGYQVFVDEMTDERGPRADEFALWHEAGTKHMRAQPFMEVSANLEGGNYLRLVAEALQAAIDQENA